MRALIFALPLLSLAACNVSKEGNAVTVQYDQNTAENTAADVGNFAQNVAGDIGNDVQRTADKVQNTDVDVTVDKNAKAARFFETLDRANRYAMIYRVNDAKRQETRRKRIAQYVDMLARGETIHPQKSAKSRPQGWLSRSDVESR